MAHLLYSPSRCTPEVLDALTVDERRPALVGELVGAVREEIDRQRHQHQLIIGSRGSGKTHTLSQVYHRLREDPELSERVLVVVLPEEQPVKHPADLLLVILDRVAEALDRAQTKEAQNARGQLIAAIQSIRTESDDRRALKFAGDAIEHVSGLTHSLIVTVIENLDSILFAGADAARSVGSRANWHLRDYLQRSHGMLVLAAALSLFEEVEDEGAAFYGFFRVHQLEELEQAAMAELLRRRIALELQGSPPDSARTQRLKEMQRSLKTRMPQLQGIMTLTGGLPRFGHLLFDLLIDLNMTSTMDLLRGFLDAQTPYFQARLSPQVVPRGELAVLEVLALADGPLRPIEVSKRIRGGSPTSVSTLLKRLVRKRLVRVRKSSPKDVRYDLSEPLYRLWRRFRAGTTEQSQLVTLAEFAAVIYSRDELLRELSDPASDIDPPRRRMAEFALARDFSIPSETIARAAPTITELVQDYRRAVAAFEAGSAPDLRAALGPAIERLQRLEASEPLALAFIARVGAEMTEGDFNAAEASVQDLLGLARKGEEEGTILLAWMTRVVQQMVRGRVSELIEELNRAKKDAESETREWFDLFLSGVQAWTHLTASRIPDFVREAQHFISLIADASEHPEFKVLGENLIPTGDGPKLGEGLETGLTLFERELPSDRTEWAYAYLDLGHCAAAMLMGRPSEAVVALDRALEFELPAPLMQLLLIGKSGLRWWQYRTNKVWPEALQAAIDFAGQRVASVFLDTFGGSVLLLETLTEAVLHMGVLPGNEQLDQLLRPVQLVAKYPNCLNATAALGFAALVRASEDDCRRLLDRMEVRVPLTHMNIIRLFRVAVLVRGGRSTTEFDELPEEERRLVREILTKAHEAQTVLAGSSTRPTTLV